MQARSIVLLGSVIGTAIVGLGVAAVLLGGPAEPPVPPPPPPEKTPTPAPADPPPEATSESRGSVPTRPPLPPGFDAPVASLDDLDVRYDVGMDTSLDFADVPVGADGDRSALAKALQDRTFQVVSTVDAAAMAHLNFAAKAPRPDALVASRQASELYDHLANVLSGAQPPSGMPAAEADLQRQVWSRMAQTHRRRAADLRARPVQGRDTEPATPP